MTAKHPLYRVYYLNQAGSITQAEVLGADDDAHAIAHAIAQAKAAAIRQTVELWDRGRFVIKLEPGDRDAAAEPTAANGLPVERVQV